MPTAKVPGNAIQGKVIAAAWQQQSRGGFAAFPFRVTGGTRSDVGNPSAYPIASAIASPNSAFALSFTRTYNRLLPACCWLRARVCWGTLNHNTISSSPVRITYLLHPLGLDRLDAVGSGWFCGLMVLSAATEHPHREPAPGRQ